MKLSANFTLDELIKSQVAERKNINNNPTPDVIENLKELCINVLQPIRSHFDKPVLISSGYRSAQICIEIGSSINSQHTLGMASDIEIWGISNKDLFDYVRNNLEFDQLILEFWKGEEQPNSGWVHVSYNKNDNRRQCLIASRNEDEKIVYKPYLGY
jgi:zinc D-Ala-D-Ala carboxypeptidase